MSNAHWIVLAILVAPVSLSAVTPSGELKRAFIDRSGRIHVIDRRNRDLRIGGPLALDVIMAPDHRSVAWSVAYKDKDGNVLSDGVRLYRQGRVRKLPCGPAASEFAFRAGGRRLVLRCAGLHFAGLQTLYDTDTLQVVASFHEAKIPLEQRPDWNVDAD
jgi:hypothetical protein